MPDPVASARWLIGHLSDHRELLMLLDERPGLLVLAADPLSGTSPLLTALVSDLSYPAVLADARGAADAMDLAMRIADAAVDRFRPEAASWWRGEGARDSAGLRLHSALSHEGVDLEELRGGGGPQLDRLRDALHLSVTLAEGQPLLLVIDHLDGLLHALATRPANQLLGALRALRQEPQAPQMLLVGRPSGLLAQVLSDPQHPLFHAGQVIRVRRASPERFVEDLAVARPWAKAPVPIIERAAELASAAPAYVWRTVDLAIDMRSVGGGPEAQASAAWDQIVELALPATVGQYELLATVHRAGPMIVSAISSGIGPYQVPAADKLVRDALRRLSDDGVIWSPEPRQWRVADPLLSDCARRLRAPWLERRARSAGSAASV